MPIKDPPKKGERRGGRKPGIPNKATLARQEAIYSSGVAPLEVIIDVMRHHYHKARKSLDASAREKVKEEKARKIAEAESSFDVALEAATRAAPYVHPKLATLQSNVNLTGRLTLGELVRMSMPQLDADNEDAPMVDVTPNGAKSSE